MTEYIDFRSHRRLMVQSSNHGGARPGSGRKSLFPGKAKDKPVSVSLTPLGRSQLDAASARLGLSRSDIIEALVRQHAAALVINRRDRLQPAQVQGNGQPHARVQFIRELSADAVRHRLRSFSEVYKSDWARWSSLTASMPLTSPETLAEFRRILGRWQAVRPRPLAGNADLTALVADVSAELDVLTDVDLRNIVDITPVQESALLTLWQQVRTRAAGRGVAGCVGITKVVMLLTKGRIGPALDSRVRTELRLPPFDDGAGWLNALMAISEDLRAFESRTHVRIEQLVERQWRPVAVGRAYDMAAGPR